MKSFMCSVMFVLLFVCALNLGAASPASSKETDAAPIPVFKPVTELPADIPTCSESDANLSGCLRKAFEQMLPRLKKGIPELNIPSMEPFIIERSSASYSNGVIEGRVILKNVRLHGLTNAKLEKFNIDLQNGHLKGESVASLPHITIEGNYKADMKINDIKLTPKGYFNVSMDNVRISAKPEGDLFEQDGHSYLRLQKIDAEPEVGDMHIFASGLMPDPNMNAVILDFINQYWRQIYQAILPETRSTWEPRIISTANAFLAAVPFDLFVKKD